MIKKSSSGYDLLAPFYDDGVGLLFGKGIFDAQLYYLKEITPQSNILILGGGSGWILTELFKICPSANITYIDASQRMLNLSMKKLHGKVKFIHGTEDDIPQNSVYDFIITNFYVDGFEYSALNDKLGSISTYLNPGGKWVVTDFVETGKKRHAFILFLIHLFFRLLIHHPNKKLVNWQGAFKELGLREQQHHHFNHGFIKTCVFTLNHSS